MEEETLTPLPTGKSVTMNFYDAIKKIMTGACVARISWGNTDYCKLDAGNLCIWREGKLHNWIVNDGDIEGMDWCVIKPTQETKTND